MRHIFPFLATEGAQKMEHIISQFQYEGMVISCTRYGSGHINETYLVVTNQPHL